MREYRKNSDLTDHEVSHSLGNGHVDETSGTLPLTSNNSQIEGIFETLNGVGIGGKIVDRNASGPIGDGTLLNESNIQGLEYGKVISKKRYDRIVKRIENKKRN